MKEFGVTDVAEPCKFACFVGSHGPQAHKYKGFRWVFISQTPVALDPWGPAAPTRGPNPPSSRGLASWGRRGSGERQPPKDLALVPLFRCWCVPCGKTSAQRRLHSKISLGSLHGQSGWRGGEKLNVVDAWEAKRKQVRARGASPDPLESPSARPGIDLQGQETRRPSDPEQCPDRPNADA